MQIKKKVLCPKCEQVKCMTQHHVYPRRWKWEEANMRDKVIELCRDCHSDLERIICRYECTHWGRRQLPAHVYLALLGWFLAKGRVA